MTIIHVVEPFATGVNTFIHELVSGMPDDRHIILHGERKDTREINGIKAEYNGRAEFISWKWAFREISLFKDFRAFMELRKVLKSTNFDILHLHSSKAGVLGRIAAFFGGYKNVVYTPNGASFLRKDISSKQLWMYQSIEQFFSRWNARIISSSESEHKEYKKLGINSRIIQNGVFIDGVKPKNENSKIFKIITCGKVTIQKNPKLLNEIASYFGDREDISFTWVGDGELTDLLTHVKVTGWSSKNEVFNHLNEADLYISTSLWEGLPLAGIEAMGFGLPLLMSKCEGNNDLVNHGINGYSFNTRIKAIENILFLMENRDTLKQQGQNSLKMYSHHFSNHRCAKEYNKLYQQIVRKTSK